MLRPLLILLLSAGCLDVQTHDRVPITVENDLGATFEGDLRIYAEGASVHEQVRLPRGASAQFGTAGLDSYFIVVDGRLGDSGFWHGSQQLRVEPDMARIRVTLEPEGLRVAFD